MVANINAVPSLDATKYSREAVEFVALCLKVEPDERPTAEQLLSHEWMRRREDTTGDAVWKSDLDDLDVILTLIIERHLMPELDSSGLDMPLLIQQHSAPVPLHSADGQHVTIEQYSATPPPSIAGRAHVLSMPIKSPSSPTSPSSASPSQRATPSSSPVPSPSAASAFADPSAAVPWLPAPQPDTVEFAAAALTTGSPSATAASLPEAPSIADSGVAHAHSAVERLHIDVSSEPQQQQAALSRHSSTSSSPASSSPDALSPSSPSSGGALGEGTVIVLDPERAEWLAEQFGVTPEEVQERFQRLWVAKTGESARADGQQALYQHPQHSV